MPKVILPLFVAAMFGIMHPAALSSGDSKLTSLHAIDGASVAADKISISKSDPYVKPTPPHAKWGRLAMAEAKKRYPSATIVDYLHVGRRAVSTNTTEEVFKFWMKDGTQEFGLFVRILFDNQTEKVLRVRCQQTVR